MKICKLQLKNIGVFDDETINFQECPAKDKAEIHILTGENGTGKTTILQALAGCFDYMYKRDALQPANHFPYTRNALYKKFKYFEFDNFENSYKSEVKVEFCDEDKLTLLGCPTCESIHYKPLITHKTDTANAKIDLYRQQIVTQAKSLLPLEFGVFVYSGNRQIKTENVLAVKESVDFNPLWESLEFVKKYEGNQLTVNQLIANNISNRASARDEGALVEAESYERLLREIENFLSEFTNEEIRFILKRKPTNIKLRIHGEELDFDVLPDGLRSLISWIADLLGRIDLLKWQDDLPITEKNLILLLDEIEVHLHPAWQRKVLPIVQKLFKNAQIFVSTHSPFVVNSVDDAWVYKLKVTDGKAKVESVTKSEDGYSYETVLREIFDIDKRFGGKTQEKLEKFLHDSRTIYMFNLMKKSTNEAYQLVSMDSQKSNFYKQIRREREELKKDSFLEDAKSLASESAELQSIVFLELAKLTNKTGESYEI